MDCSCYRQGCYCGMLLRARLNISLESPPPATMRMTANDRGNALCSLCARRILPKMHVMDHHGATNSRRSNKWQAEFFLLTQVSP
eukprot:6179424-Pleurochrysis_carterae.AAC.4